MPLVSVSWVLPTNLLAGINDEWNSYDMYIALFSETFVSAHTTVYILLHFLILLEDVFMRISAAQLPGGTQMHTNIRCSTVPGNMQPRCTPISAAQLSRGTCNPDAHQYLPLNCPGEHATQLHTNICCSTVPGMQPRCTPISAAQHSDYLLYKAVSRGYTTQMNTNICSLTL